MSCVFFIKENYPPATPHLHDNTNERDSESVWASLMRKRGVPEGSRKAPKQSQSGPSKIRWRGRKVRGERTRCETGT